MTQNPTSPKVYTDGLGRPMIEAVGDDGKPFLTYAVGPTVEHNVGLLRRDFTAAAEHLDEALSRVQSAQRRILAGQVEATDSYREALMMLVSQLQAADLGLDELRACWEGDRS